MFVAVAVFVAFAPLREPATYADESTGAKSATQPGPPTAAPAAVEQVILVRSDAFKKDFPVTVVLPAGYGQAARVANRYGLLVLLHGAGGDNRDWAKEADLRSLATKYGRIIVVPTAGPNSWWVDYAGNPPNFAATFVAGELMAALKKAYRVSDGGGHWITGNSMGGYGAIRIGLAHPELFSCVGGLSACIRPRLWRAKWDLTAAMGPPAGRADLLGSEQVKALKQQNRQVLSILCGRRDSLFMRENQAAHALLSGAGIPHQWLDVDGQHNWAFWKTHLATQLEYFQEQSQKAQSRAGND
jgi:S-formylglutathione hydrolase FrmB